MEYGLVIPAAGSGQRMGTGLNKQFMLLGNYPVLLHTLSVFLKIKQFLDIVLVVKKEDIAYCRENILHKYGVTGVKIVAGGKTRRQSVFYGLQNIVHSINYVIIHDGARPLIPLKVITNLINCLNKYPAITTGVKVKDTIKKKTNNSYVDKTYNRNNLVAIQTPQAFERDLILKAHQEVPEKESIADDASLVELYGQPVKIIEGSYENIKITTPIDLIYGEAIMKKRNKEI